MLALSPDGRWLATTGADFSIHIWDVESGKLAHATSGQYTPSVVAFSSDGRRVAVNGGGTDLGSAVQIWDIARQAQLTVPKVKQRVTGLSYSRDGAYLAVSSPGLEVFDTRTNTSVAQFDCGTAPALSPVFSPNRKWVAANCRQCGGVSLRRSWRGESWAHSIQPRWTRAGCRFDNGHHALRFGGAEGCSEC